ncbi:MAG: hypothetical protein U9R51_07250 [Actinomycetota bacterium]|nr:hypothetical protein [Actinomycetota bacterium]
MGFEAEYVARFRERQTLLFSDYARGDDVDLQPVEASMYALCSSYDDQPSQHRRRRVLASVATRGRVDWHPTVSDLRIRLEDSSEYGVPETASRGALGAAMEDDLVKLIETRNRLAVDEGFESYADLAMWSEGLDLTGVRHFVAAVRNTTLPEAVRTITRERMTLETWFEDCERFGGPGPDDIPAAASTLSCLLDLDEIAGRISWVVREQPIYGAAFALAVPSDVRILVGRSGSLTASMTAYHELGHALGHAANRTTGILQTWETTVDESMAVVMEAVASRLVLDDHERSRMAIVEALETARLSTSLMFEFGVNERPHQSRELFEYWYGPLAPFDDAAMWARDTFRSVDPFHIQAYLVGNVVADATLAFLTDRFPDDPPAWGSWLVENYYAPGRGATLSDRLNALEDHRPKELDDVFVA